MRKALFLLIFILSTPSFAQTARERLEDIEDTLHQMKVQRDWDEIYRLQEENQRRHEEHLRQMEQGAQRQEQLNSVPAPVPEYSPGQSQTDAILNIVIKTIIVAALSIGVLYFFRKVGNTSDKRPINSSDETAYTETAFKEVSKVESIIVVCPNCKSKYKVPQGRHLEISCKQKNCLYKWKTFT